MQSCVHACMQRIRDRRRIMRNHAFLSTMQAMAAKVEEFHKKTPARFRSRPGPVPEHSAYSGCMTSPHAPQLMTAARYRPTYVKVRASSCTCSGTVLGVQSAGVHGCFCFQYAFTPRWWSKLLSSKS